MTAIINDAQLEMRLRRERAVTGADRFDEVWQGVYVMAPLANDEHQKIVSRLISIFEATIGWPGLGEIRPGVNISDRVDNWRENYRRPDVAVFLNNTSAQNHQTFWLGGPDFAVEVVSDGDRTLEKLPFYASVRTPELLVIHRQPWRLELYKNQENEMVLASTNSISSESECVGSQLGFEFAMVDEGGALHIRVTHAESAKTWEV